MNIVVEKDLFTFDRHLYDYLKYISARMLKNHFNMK